MNGITDTVNSKLDTTPLADLPGHNGLYKELEYWESRYKNEKEFDWFASYGAFRHLVKENVKKTDHCLILGCGNSSLSAEMYRDGFHNITNVDYSPVVIETMASRHKDMKDMAWEVKDITQLNYNDMSYDVIMEKGTLDAMLVDEKDPWHISDEGIKTTHSILSQVSRILRPGGCFISITFAQPHFRKILYARTEYSWSISVKTFGNGFHYFFYVMTKGAPLSDKDRNLVREYEERIAKVRQLEPVSESEDEEFLIKNMNL